VLGAAPLDKIERASPSCAAQGAQALGTPLDVARPASLARFLDTAWDTVRLARRVIHNAGVEPGRRPTR
jgi:NAD(P)-dependent dehydrogenase (short-subunit alcohol dehydrogenase family)